MGVARVYKWEMLKLLAQKRTYLGLGAAMLVPLVFVVVLILKTGGPTDIPLGRYLRETGLATPFVVLFFMSIWAFPLITALVAGDIVAAESHNGTLKTILTRSRDRGEIYAAKALAALTYTTLVVLRDGGRRADRGDGSMGVQRPDVALGHRRCTPATVSPCSPAASASTCGRWPASRRSALLLSTVTRNSAASVVGTLMWALLMQLLGVLPGTESIRPVPARHAVRGLARPSSHARRLGSGRPGGLGVRDLPGAPLSPATSSSCAATSRASSRPPFR